MSFIFQTFFPPSIFIHSLRSSPTSFPCFFVIFFRSHLLSDGIAWQRHSLQNPRPLRKVAERRIREGKRKIERGRRWTMRRGKKHDCLATTPSRPQPFWFVAPVHSQLPPPPRFPNPYLVLSPPIFHYTSSYDGLDSNRGIKFNADDRKIDSGIYRQLRNESKWRILCQLSLAILEAFSRCMSKISMTLLQLPLNKCENQKILFIDKFLEYLTNFESQSPKCCIPAYT